MNRRQRREMVRGTPDGQVDKLSLIRNSHHVLKIFRDRLEDNLKSKNLEYYIDENTGEVVCKDEGFKVLYDIVWDKLIEELKKVKGDYKKL